MQMRLNNTLAPEQEELIRGTIGAAIEVHRHLGPGFLEGIYEQALCTELELREIIFERQKALPVWYKGRILNGQRLDLLVASQIIIELKAVNELAPIHHAQLQSYLRAANLRAGLLINFNVKLLREGIKRVIL